MFCTRRFGRRVAAWHLLSLLVKVSPSRITTLHNPLLLRGKIRIMLLKLIIVKWHENVF